MYIDGYTDSLGHHYDLNKSQTYTKSWFPYPKLNAEALRERIQTEIGLSLYHMICYDQQTDWGNQYHRVVAFGRFFAREIREPDRWENKLWLRKQLFLILDEVENQC